MKKIFCIISIFVVLSNIAKADEHRDINKYNIADESNYAIFIYDLKNSLVQKYGKGNEIDGEMKAALAVGNLDLLDIKYKMIHNMQQEHLTFLVGNFTSEKFERISQPFIDAVNEYASTVENIELSDAFIYMYMQTPEFYGKPWVNDYPKHILHNAESIAISRFDNKYWFDEIKTCYSKNAPKEDMIDIISECAQEYQQVVTEETGKVLQQLEPYKHMFETLPQTAPN
ncbi:MAG: hypothetical protein IJ099_02995 [Alphaproteobacteria bacterium]|nr:hypothetical protein [Alphaproteobacteria bacterium]